jgi:hypothetical protein
MRVRDRLVWLWRHFPVVAAFFIGVVYIVTVLAKFSEDTTGVINAAVAITGALASLCFGMSASVGLKDKLKDRVNYAGERFFHAAIFFLMAAVLKYAALKITANQLLEGREMLAVLVAAPFHMFVLGLFMYAVLDTHSGIRVINAILWERLHRVEDWDDLV